MMMFIAGPDGSPRHCDLCNYPPRPTDSDHDSLSPDNDRLWLQMDSSSSSLEEYIPANITNASSIGTGPGFSMNGMLLSFHVKLCCDVKQIKDGIASIRVGWKLALKISYTQSINKIPKHPFDIRLFAE